MAILILGGEDDQHALHMRDYLRAKGADVELLDSRRFPGEVQISLDPGLAAGWIDLGNERRLGFEQITAVYWRIYYGIGLPGLPDFGQDQIAQNDARSLFESFLIGLPARWVNGWNAFQLHQTKPVQLARIAARGVAVPATICSNAGDAICEFSARHPQSIFKPVQGGAHARRVTARHLDAENLASLRVSPVTLQEEVAGESVRVFVAGERVLACRLETEALDYRDDPNPAIEAIDLPDEVAAQCLDIARTLELVWTGIDFRRTPGGRYVFLEANPSPMFLGFESRTGLPLTEALGDVLRRE